MYIYSVLNPALFLSSISFSYNLLSNGVLREDTVKWFSGEIQREIIYTT